MDTKTKKRIAALIAGFEALEYEAHRRDVPGEPVPGGPVEPVSGGSAFADCLRALLAGDERPVREWLGLVQRNGRPPMDDQAKIELLRQARVLAVQENSREAAAHVIGVDQRTLGRWRDEVAGVAEELDARLSGLGRSAPGDKVKDKT